MFHFSICVYICVCFMVSCNMCVLICVYLPVCLYMFHCVYMMACNMCVCVQFNQFSSDVCVYIWDSRWKLHVFKWFKITFKIIVIRNTLNIISSETTREGTKHQVTRDHFTWSNGMRDIGMLSIALHVEDEFQNYKRSIIPIFQIIIIKLFYFFLDNGQ